MNNQQNDELAQYQSLLSSPRDSSNNVAQSNNSREELRIAPLIWWDVKEHLEQDPSTQLRQYAILGSEPSKPSSPLKPVLLNTNSPWSAFICGSQGSGKSHTLSCMLENCLLDDVRLGKNSKPLAGLVMHYDGSRGNGVCEAAYLCSKVETTVLVSKSNYSNLKDKYEDMARKCGGKVNVQKLVIASKHLDTERVKTLMAVSREGDVPLYIHTLIKLIRDIAIENEGTGYFDYATFKSMLENQVFTDRQSGPLRLRIDLLESFLDTSNTKKDFLVGDPGKLLIIDLTDPVIDPDMACVLFDTCLSIFLAQTPCGKVATLDEAHNYLLAENAAAKQFTGKILKTIREQRHSGTRMIVATQEPTIDTSLLDLCSIAMVHCCTSPAWFQVLKKHIAALFLSADEGADGGTEMGRKLSDRALFAQIVGLELGESLLFCPTAVMGVEGQEFRRMKDQFVTLRTRQRITADGGRTRLAEDA